MDKQEIKERLLEAVEHSLHLADITSVAIFGSYVRGSQTSRSDIDILRASNKMKDF